jgi:parallel beta-helix repeat protein
LIGIPLLSRVNRACLFLLTCLLSVLHSEVGLGGSSYYVATTGSNAGGGTLDSPWQTISYGMTRLAPGDTLLVRGGSYHEYVRALGYAGIRTAPKVVMSYPGERAIIDGQKDLPGLPYSMGLVHLDGDYWVLRDLTVINSSQPYGMGIYMGGTGDRVIDCIVHDTGDMGIYAGGDSSLVDGCTVYNACLANYDGYIWTHGGTWGVGITASRGAGAGTRGIAGKDDTTDYAIVRNCTVHDVWGEGISTYEAKHTLLENNTIYDAYSAHLYISDAAYVTARGNLIYATKVMTNAIWGMVSTGILIGDERKNIFSRGHTVVGNIVLGTRHCLYLYNSREGLCANNTFISSVDDACVSLSEVNGKPDIRGWRFTNNIIQQDNPTKVASLVIKARAGHVRVDHNMYNKRGKGFHAGRGDVIDTAHFIRTGSLAAGQLMRDYFALGAGSPAIDRGINIGLPFAGRAPDLGALESGSSNVSGVNQGRKEDGGVTSSLPVVKTNRVQGLDSWGNGWRVWCDSTVSICDMISLVGVRAQ